MKSKDQSTHCYKTLPQLLAILLLFINISTAFSSGNNSTEHFGFKGYVTLADQQLADLHYLLQALPVLTISLRIAQKKKNMELRTL